VRENRKSGAPGFLRKSQESERASYASKFAVRSSFKPAAGLRGCDANLKAGGSLKKAESPNGYQPTDFMQVSDVSDCVGSMGTEARHIKNLSTSQDNWRCPEHRMYL